MGRRSLVRVLGRSPRADHGAFHDPVVAVEHPPDPAAAQATRLSGLDRLSTRREVADLGASDLAAVVASRAPPLLGLGRTPPRPATCRAWLLPDVALVAGQA